VVPEEALMRIVFFGSPGFAVPSLEALVASRHEVVAVVTQPDRPAGRGHAETPPPAKQAALARGLPVLQPEKVSDPEPLAAIQALAPDAFVVAAYGQILRQRLLNVPPRGTLNVHASLLPRWRGASPVAAAIMAGDEVTGVTLMQMVRALDAGPMLARVETPISPHDTTGTLEPRLAVAGAELLAKNLGAWLEGRLAATPQDESLVTYAPQIRRTDALLDWHLPAVDLWRRVRAFHPWPVAYTRWRGEDVRIHAAWPLEVELLPKNQDTARLLRAWRADLVPGTVLPTIHLPREAQDPVATFVVQTGRGVLAIQRLQRQGRRELFGWEFLNGERDFIGTVLGE
jgi:methionyl-tRNA formyltransferase